MAEQEIFEARLRTALARRVADGPTDFDALEFARSVAAAEPRRHGRPTPRAGSLVGFPTGRSPAARMAWALAAAALLIVATVTAVFVGSELLRRSSELTVVPPPAVDLTITVTTGELSSIAWSPDGAHLAAAASDGTVKVLDTTTGEETLILQHDLSPDPPNAAPLSVEYSPDGTGLAVGSTVYDAATGEVLVDLRDAFRDADPGGVMAYSPDGTRIGVLVDLAWGVHVQIHDAVTGDELLWVGRIWGPSACVWWSMAWSPDGTRLAVACGMDIEVWDATTSESKQYEISSWFVVTDVGWSPDGARIAATGGQDTGVWDATPGGEVVAIGRVPLRATDVAWNPDGTRIATAGHDGMARILDAATGGELVTLAGHTGPLNDVAWSPDGARIATAGSDGTVRVWAVTLAVAPTPSVTPTPSASPSPSPSPTPTPATVRIVEGTDILATTKARPLPVQATCPPGSDPDALGPSGQEGPIRGDGAMAFDRHAGRIVALANDDQPGRRTYTFDVCTNTWQWMEPWGAEQPLWDDPVRLVYDADSDRTLAFEADRVWSYDLAADRWTMEGRFASPIRGIAGWGSGDRTAAVYHEPSGLVIVYDGESMWAYDVDTNSMTTVRQLPDVSPPTGSGVPEGVTAVVYDRDRDLLIAAAATPDELRSRDASFLRSDSRPYWAWVETAALEIWAFDPGTSRWRLMPSQVPAGVLWQDSGYFVGPANRVSFDEASGVTLFMSSDGWTEVYDGQRGWRAHPSAGNRSWCDSLDPVYDPINGRIVCRAGSLGGVAAFSTATGQWRWLVEPWP